MKKALYSHAFLVGSFNGIVNPQDLVKNGWKLKTLSKSEYDERLTMYYKSHVDAMVEVEGNDKPEFLKDVHHYQYSYQTITKDEKGYDKYEKMGERVSISFEKNGTMVKYPFVLCNLDLYFFPFDIVLVSIEIDDSGSELNMLTFAHSKLVNWESKIKDIADDTFKKCFDPICSFLPEKDLSKLVSDGNNLKIFQIVKGKEDAPVDERLFEIATFSPIPSVKGHTENSLSEDYYNKIMAENSVSTYFNWKGLALVDSFTVLGGKDFEKRTWQWLNLYYPLVYLRCILEKTFCFSRNNAYRRDEKQMTVKKLSEDIAMMERYYFYGNFSYNFQPNLVYEAIIKGLDIKNEREDLTKQVKERAKAEEERLKEKKEHRFNRILAWVSAFAVISVVWDFCSIVKNAFSIDERNPSSPYIAWGFILLGIVIFIILYKLILRKNADETN